ncbi:TPA: LPXTG cell wall anchor domain-containing protein [Streptococcus suis]|nr:LPXTG cell wall anchor domain-containing protein [Streptococcus suis]
MSTKKTYLLRKTSIGLVSLAALAVVGTTVSANEIGVATAHGTGAYADPIPTFNINTGELTAKGSSVLNSDYKPALDPSTVDIFVKGGENGVATTLELPEVKVAFENGEPYVYAHGTGVTATVELPTLDPSTVDITKNGEGVTAEELPAVEVSKDENGEYLSSKGTGVTAPELPAIDPATLKETPAEKEETKSEEVPAAASKAAAASSAKLPETGEASSAVYFVTALGLLGAAVVAKRKEN